MADFKTHVTFSSVLGCGYSVAGMMAGMPPSTALVAGGLCGVSGMLPDVDSDSGVPRREAMGFAAAIVPMLLVDRLEQLQLGYDQMILVAALLYFGIRFVAARLIGKWSVHRGMWHSIPAVLIFAGVAFLISGSTDLTTRYFKAFAVGLGALSHLVLDEVYSVDTRGVVPKFKKSFGTAVKLWGKHGWANFSTYAKLAIVVGLIVAEPSVMARIESQSPHLANRLRGYGQRLRGYANQSGGQPGAPAMGGQLPAQQPTPPGFASPAVAPSQQPAWTTPQSPAPGYPPAYQQPAGPFSAPVYQQPSNPYYQGGPTPGYAQPQSYAPSNGGQPFSAQAPTGPPAIQRQ